MVSYMKRKRAAMHAANGLLAVLAVIAGFIIATIDAQPMWLLTVLACLAWGVYMVFLTVTLHRDRAKCPSCDEVL